MRVFLDTNVLVSAFATRGLSSDVMRFILAEHELLTGQIVLEELERALTEKIRAPERVIREALGLLEEHHVEPTAEADPDLDVGGPDDARVLATARAAGADVLVTGDSDLLELRGRVPGLEILDPRGFWEAARG